MITITVTVPTRDVIHGELRASLPDGELVAPCAIGRSGVIAAADKREGDGATPLGDWKLRQIYYRADNITAPKTFVPSAPIEADMGWCDASDHPDYNRLVRLPFDASHEKMARDDHLYDLVVVLGHNDDPPVPEMGSAIFWHLRRGEADPSTWKPTAGCVATTSETLYKVLAHCDETSVMSIRVAKD